MKAAKLVIGIISCVLFIIIMFQSCAATVVEAMEESDGVSGGAGLLTAIFMLVASIIGIVSHKSSKGGGTIACIIFYTLAGLVGVCMHGIYTDLLIWGCLSFIFAVVHIFFQIKGEPRIKSSTTV